MRLLSADHLPIRRIPIVLSLTVFVGVLALAGCGGSKSSSTTTSSTSSTSAPATTTAATQTTPASPSSSAETLSLEANSEGQLKYNKTSLTAKTGSVSIDFTNSSPLAHNVTIESSSGATVGATPTFDGGSKTLKVTLKAGTYKFYCSVPGHRMAGMEGTLVVK